MDIEAYRLRTKKTVAELAKLLGVKEAAIYNYKYGKSKPSYESIEKMLLDGAYLSEIFSEEVQKKVAESIKISDSTENSSDQPIKRFTREEVLSFLSQLSDIAKDETSGSATENSTK